MSSIIYLNEKSSKTCYKKKDLTKCVLYNAEKYWTFYQFAQSQRMCDQLYLQIINRLTTHIEFDSSVNFSNTPKNLENILIRDALLFKKLQAGCKFRYTNFLN